LIKKLQSAVIFINAEPEPAGLRFFRGNAGVSSVEIFIARKPAQMLLLQLTTGIALERTGGQNLLVLLSCIIIIIFA
jgi:hypothetical protein